MTSTRLAVLATALLAVACAAPGASTRPSTAASAAPTSAATMAPSVAPSAAAGEAVCDNLPTDAAGDLLETICERGTIKMSTDPEYPPQSELAPDSEMGYEGFDIDVGAEIARRLGVDIAFETPSWDVLTAGSWNGRWDFSVGSMTITSEREGVLDFTQPYYYTPAQMAVRSDSTIADLDGLAGKAICVGEGTTYLAWIEGTLDFGSATSGVTASEPPDGSTATTLPTDRNCAENWQSGRHDFDGWLTSITTAQGAVDDGLPVKLLGEPVFFEPLAVAFDQSAADHDALVEAVDQIVADMHEDGTLSELSTKWFDQDYTVSTQQ